MSTAKKILCFLLVLILTIGVLCGCSAEGTESGSPAGSGSEEDTAALRDSTPRILSAEPLGETVEENEYASIDLSSTGKGFICVCYYPGEPGKLQLKKDDVVYTYDLSAADGWQAFPLSLEDGEYTAVVYQKVAGTQYVQVCSSTFSVVIDDPYTPYLYPNKYVSFTDDPVFSALSRELAEECYSDLDVIGHVYDYVVDTLTYDYDLAASAPVNYIPDLSETLETKTGICFDYASLLAALLRSQGIPARVVVGYAGSEYHAWIGVFISEIGWVDDIIQFDGKQWTRMDPTYASTYTGTKKSLSSYLSNSGNYQDMYFY